ncbi:glutactin-like [Vespula squamosa]|uniref:Glutactin-like n=1 Tax=Vespula squamosa TaxID=30214 RepID=A0ABD2BGN5_VESSQ
MPVKIDLWYQLVPVNRCTMLILYAVVSIITLTSALNVPNLSEDTRERISTKDISNQKSFINGESIKSLTSDNYAPGSRSQTLEREHYPQVPINQNSATGGSFSSSYQAKQPFANTEHFSTPYFEQGFVNPHTIKATLQIRPIESSQIQKLRETNSNEDDNDRKKIIGGISGVTNYDYPFLSSQQKIVPSFSDIANNQKEIPTNNVQLPIYRTHYPGPKNSDYVFSYMPGHQSVSNLETKLPSSDNLHQYFPENEATTTTKKITLPVVQVKNSQYIPGYLRTFENKPVLLNHDLNYLQPNLNFGFIGAKEKTIAQAANNISPFQSSISSFQGQVIPIQTASSTPEFPQYKGAAVATYPVSLDLAKIPRTYEPLRTQPQLHFQNVLATPIVNPYQNVNLNSKAAEEIRDDVEIIKKKPPQPPRKNDEDEFDDEDKSVEAEYRPNYNDEEVYRSKSTKESSLESDFVPSKSFPFKEYDEKFGKDFKKNNKDDEDDKPSSDKFRSYSSSENDEDGRSSKYSDDYESSEARRTNYENDDEDEERNERYESEREPQEDRKEESNGSKYFRRDFDREFDDIYKKPLTKNKYINTKEVPEGKYQKSGFNRYKEESDDEETNHPFNYNRKKNYRNLDDTRKRSTEILSNINPIGKELTSNYGGFYVPSIVNSKIRTLSNEKVFRDLTGI